MEIKIPEIDTSKIRSKELAEQVRQLINIIEAQAVYIRNLQKEHEQLKEAIRKLQRQPKKPKFTKHEEKKGKKESTNAYSVTKLLGEEQQEWHKRSKKGKIPIDREIQLPEAKTCSCGSEEFTALRGFEKITQGLVLKRDNVRYHGREKRCNDCGKIHRSQLPPELKGSSFDPSLHTIISYFKFYCRMTHPLLHKLMIGFGIQISYGEITEILHKNSDKLKKTYEHLRTVGYKKSAYLQSDATGAKRKDKRTGKIIAQYIQVISTRLISVFTITNKYNIPTVQKLLGKIGRWKPFESDDSSANRNWLIERIRQLCWIHEIRHYMKLFPFFTPYQTARDNILKLWGDYYHKAKKYKESPNKKEKGHLIKLFDEITSQITGFDLLDKQLRLTKKKKKELLAFLDYPFLPIHNNQCEQDLREAVIQRKISKETKSIAGNKSIARHLSIIQTAQKQGLDVFKTLHGLLTGQLSSSILTVNI